MASAEAKMEAEKFRLRILNVALATKVGSEGDLKAATEDMINGIAQSLDAFVHARATPGT